MYDGESRRISQLSQSECMTARISLIHNKQNIMATPEFKYAPMFQLGKDDTEYYLLTKEGVSVSEFEGGQRSLQGRKLPAAPLAQRAGGKDSRRPRGERQRQVRGTDIPA